MHREADDVVNIMEDLNRLNALLTWWRSPATEDTDKLAADLRETYRNACHRQANIMFLAHERLTGSLRDLIHSRNQRKVATVNAAILTALLDSVDSKLNICNEIKNEIEVHRSSIVNRYLD